MIEPLHTTHSAYALLPTKIDGIDSLAELALDMRWSWNHATDGLVRVELCAAGVAAQDMKRAGQTPSATGSYAYHAVVPAARPETDYTARLIPHHARVAIPLEEARILWQR